VPFPFLKILEADISKKLKFLAKKNDTPAWDGRNRVMPPYHTVVISGPSPSVRWV